MPVYTAIWNDIYREKQNYIMAIIYIVGFSKSTTEYSVYWIVKTYKFSWTSCKSDTVLTRLVIVSFNWAGGVGTIPGWKPGYNCPRQTAAEKRFQIDRLTGSEMLG